MDKNESPTSIDYVLLYFFYLLSFQQKIFETAKVSIVGGSEKYFLTCFMQVLFFIATLKTRTTVLNKSDKGIKLDFCLKPAYMYSLDIKWQLVSHQSWIQNVFK